MLAQQHLLLRNAKEYETMSKQLEQLPKTITNNISTDKDIIEVRGGEVEYYPSTGNNIGAMIFDHDEFQDSYEINSHTVNFSKDRDHLQIGGSLYNARIRRMVRDRIDVYTLATKRGERSPLFVPYKDNAFLVLEPLN